MAHRVRGYAAALFLFFYNSESDGAQSELSDRCSDRSASM
jgi:hypothetical protein